MYQKNPSFPPRVPYKRKRKSGVRLPLNKWMEKRRKVYEIQKGHCQSPHCTHLGDWTLPLNQSHVDHIIPISKGGTNALKNLRVLCRCCHGLRRDESHRGLTRDLLEQGLLPENWQELLWDG